MPPPQGLSLWDFSARLYGDAAVAAACIRLQDEHAIDVNLLLYAAWLGQVQGVALDTAGVQAASDATFAWQSRVVMPIRSLRRALKAIGAHAAGAEVESVRSHIQAAELEAERIEQQRLEALGRPEPSARDQAAGSGLAMANLALVIACGAQPAGPAASRELDAFRRALDDATR